MTITGLTPREVHEKCKEAGLTIPFKTILSAFDADKKKGGHYGPRLKVLRPTAKMRVCTYGSFDKWFSYLKERHDVKTGRKCPEDCHLIHKRTALRLHQKYNESQENGGKS